MSHIEDLISHHCPSGVEEKLISDVATLERGKYISKKTAIPGDIPVIAGGRGPAYWHNEANRTGELLTVAGSGAYAGFVQYWDSPIFVSDAFSITTDPQLNTRFLFHWMKNKQDFLHSLKKGSGVPHVYPKDIAKLKIPVPPLEVQDEIVRILDSFTNLEANLQIELEARRQQYEYYRDSLLKSVRNSEEKSIADLIIDVKSGTSKKSDWAEDGLYPLFGSTGQIATTNRLLYSGPAILIARVGAYAGKVYVVDGDYGVSDNALIMHPNPSWNLRYAFHQLTAINLRNLAKGGGQPLVTGGDLKKMVIKVPPLSEQERIVAILDKFDALVNDLSSGLPAEIAARRKQYEYYRDRLLVFTPSN